MRATDLAGSVLVEASGADSETKKKAKAIFDRMVKLRTEIDQIFHFAGETMNYTDAASKEVRRLEDEFDAEVRRGVDAGDAVEVELTRLWKAHYNKKG